MQTKLSKEEFQLFRTFIHKECGIHLSEQKEYLIQQRLESLVKNYDCSNFSDFYRLANNDETGIIKSHIVSAITTRETYFFRDMHPFLNFAKIILPKLKAKIIERKNAKFVRKGPKVSIWSAAASSGQEPYTIAMLIDEFVFYAGTEISTNDFGILATDISDDALVQAIQGEYNEIEISRGLADQYKRKYFSLSQRNWVLNDKIKSMVQFRKLNLMDSLQSLGGFDVIFCRNVLIYFDEQTKNKLLDEFNRILAPNGYLILGSTENLLVDQNKFVAEKYGETTYYRKK